MIYIKRLGNIVLVLLCFLARVILRALLILLGIIQTVTTFSMIPVILILEFLEIVLVHPIYYIITGHKYKEKYNDVIDMFGDFVYVTGRIAIRKDDNRGFRDDEWYIDKWKAINDIKIEL